MMSQRISFDSEVREARVWMRDPELFVWLLRSFFLPSCFCVLLHRGNWRVISKDAVRFYHHLTMWSFASRAIAGKLGSKNFCSRSNDPNPDHSDDEKHYFLLWMVESMNGDRLKSQSSIHGELQPTGRRKFRKLILVIILQPNGVRRFCDSAWQE
ncbi:hypothetical protein MUK42_13351 [Musa troglodytarum]|uniref:Uncharacterized protein n=1 Tax=Musa troglodytarum TaxID=320322 RepID=A0A9E7GXW4_9LILI|nr:hypothetical protein MUK42_13351 [Musa troglodytarum]